MKITDWTLYTPDRNFHVFVEIHADQGISVWGASYSEKGQVLGALEWLKRFVMGYPNLAVKRAILLGISLGAIAQSLRILFGIERSYLGAGD